MWLLRTTPPVFPGIVILLSRPKAFSDCLNLRHGSTETPHLESTWLRTSLLITFAWHTET